MTSLSKEKLMKRRIKAFLKEAGIAIDNQLIGTVFEFLTSPTHRIVFHHGHLYFLNGAIVTQSMAYSGNDWYIYEFDGHEITRIDGSYYLGENTRSQHNQSDSGSSNNNNNNNGNNG